MPASEKENSFFSGIDVRPIALTSTDPVIAQQLAELSSRLQQASDDFFLNKPAEDAPELLDAFSWLTTVMDTVQKSNLTAAAKFDLQTELATRREYINDALILALHLSLETNADGAEAATGSVIPGQKFTVTVRAFGGANLSSAPSVGDCGEHTQSEHDTHDVTSHCNVTLPDIAALTRLPLNHPSDKQAWYDFINSAPKLNTYALIQDGVQPAIVASVDFMNPALPVTMQVPVMVERHLVGQNIFREPLTVVPAISITLDTHAGTIPLNGSFQLPVHLLSNVHGISDATVELQLPAGWSSTPTQATFHSAAAGDTQTILFTVKPSQMQPGTNTITATADYDGKKYTSGYTIAGYAGLPRSYYYRPATFQVTGADFQIAPNLKIGYIMGTGDEVPQSLALMGQPVQLLTDEDIASGDLSRFDEIILGVRAYSARPALVANNKRLLEYAQQGGTVIAQYGTAEFDHNYGPYPFTLGWPAENVVEQSAAVTLLAPEHPLLAWPNHITTQDFDNWVEERGHSFMRTWDPQYTALTETHDANQDAQRGGLLVAHTGKGMYVYVAYALYRELPEGVPGAARIFANLLSLPKNPQK